MRRNQPPASKGVLEVDWPFFGELARALVQEDLQARAADVLDR
jgi:hypothetical protein